VGGSLYVTCSPTRWNSSAMGDVSTPMTNAGSTHVPDDHAGHDRQLVVAFACGDLPAEDLADAQALVARCRRCAALVDEIAHISAAIAHDFVAPPRHRDFRLTSVDAERLRGNAVTRLLRRLGGPRLQVLQPLAGTAMAVGLVLLVTTAVVPDFSGAAGAAPLPAAIESVGEDDEARDAAVGEAPGGAELAPASPSVGAALGRLGTGSPSPDIAASTDTSTKANALQLDESYAAFDPIAPVGLGLLILGAIVLLVLVVARRASGDPLLR